MGRPLTRFAPSGIDGTASSCTVGRIFAPVEPDATGREVAGTTCLAPDLHYQKECDHGSCKVLQDRDHRRRGMSVQLRQTRRPRSDQQSPSQPVIGLVGAALLLSLMLLVIIFLV